MEIKQTVPNTKYKNRDRSMGTVRTNRRIPAGAAGDELEILSSARKTPYVEKRSSTGNVRRSSTGNARESSTGSYKNEGRSMGTVRTNRRIPAGAAGDELEILSFARETPYVEKRSSTGNVRRSSTESARRSSTESVRRSSTESARRSNTESIRRISTESARRNSTGNVSGSSTGRGKRHRRKSNKRKNFVLAAGVIVILVVIAGFVYYELPHRCVRESVTIEAGDTCPSVAEFLEWECEEAFFASGINEDMEFKHVQDYEVTIHLYHQDVTAILHVVDTIPPMVLTKDRTIMFGDSFEIEDFIEGIYDVTACEVSYQEEPTIQGGGIYAVILEVEDEGGNITEAEAQLEVLQDVTPPVIEGVEEITITEGEGISYKKNIVVTDDYDEAVQLEIDNSEVDTNTPGDYRVVYRAEDKYGNATVIETVVHVKAKPKVVTTTSTTIPKTEEGVNAEADRILASITNSSMSQYEVLRAIYDWCHSKIAYTEGTSKTDWVDGAYAGIVKRRGDCYAYAMSAKCLLTRAGITNMDIERAPLTERKHFWNLVDIGEGWHHFDTCRRADGSTFFYLTDAELMAYSEAHITKAYPMGTHYYDRSLYPEIP